MTYSFRPASREGVQLVIGAAGASGSGKTFTLLMIATGLAYPEASSATEINAIREKEGRNRIVFIDTERGRGRHYAPPPGELPDPWRAQGAWFAFDYAELEPPYNPKRFAEIVQAADAEGYVCIILDSLSHEWTGEGGVLDWHEAEQLEKATRKANYGNNGPKKEPSWSDLEAVKMTAWIKPKMAHKEMVGKLTTLRANLLVGLRAEEKVKFVQEYDDRGQKKGKEKIVSAKDLPPAERWSPVCEKGFPFELTISFVLSPDAPGVPNFIKLQDQHRPFVEMGRPLSWETGRKLAEWTSGAAPGAGAKPAASNGTKARRTPEELVDGYIAGLKAPPAGKVASLGDLAGYQQAAAKFLAGLKAQREDLHQRCVEANADRFKELSPPDEGEPGGDMVDADSLFGGEE